MAIYDNQDDSLDRSSFLTGDHDDYNTYSLDWPENVFGETIPSAGEDTEGGFKEELDGDTPAPGGTDDGGGAPAAPGDGDVTDEGDETDEEPTV